MRSENSEVQSQSTNENAVYRVVLPFKDQKSADAVKKQLSNLSSKIDPTLQPVFKSRKICEDLRAWTNDKCLATKHHLVWCCLIVFHRGWSCLIEFGRVWLILKAIKHSIKSVKHFFCSRVWWAMFCSFGQPLIKHAYHACSAACINCLIFV